MLIIPCGNCGKKIKYACPADMKRRRKTNKCRQCYLSHLRNNGLPAKWKKNVLKSIKSGKDNPNWKGGQYISGSGYRLIHMPNHPYCKGNGYIFEHRIIMEKQIGRYLKPDEIIHHLNGNKLDNRIENLVITDKYEHAHKYDAHSVPKKLHCSLCSEKPIGRGFCKRHYWTEFLKAHRAEMKKK